jgi:hypothetical protein
MTRADVEAAFRIATKALPIWYADQVAAGMTDEALETALERVLGIFGGSCGPGQLDVMHQGAGLKIWAGWHIVNHVTEAPIIRGQTVVAMAREVYGIPNPDDRQLPLL